MFESGDIVVIVSAEYPELEYENEELYGDAFNHAMNYHHYEIGDVCRIVSCRWDEFYKGNQYLIEVIDKKIALPKTQYVFDLHISPTKGMTNKKASAFLSDEY